jgi:hypothetical protein
MVALGAWICVLASNCIVFFLFCAWLRQFEV